MITLNARGHKARKTLIDQGIKPDEAYRKALADPQNQYRKSKK
ncbi:MAG: hypothetical protein AAFY24_01990 [Pseudomonadota bacterium]